MLLTFENGWEDSLRADGQPEDDPPWRHADRRRQRECGIRLARRARGLAVLTAADAGDRGTRETSAHSSRSRSWPGARTTKPRGCSVRTRISGAIKTTELVFDCDPNGKCLPGLAADLQGYRGGVEAGDVATTASTIIWRLRMTRATSRSTWTEGKRDAASCRAANRS